ncbi:MAG: MBL fold metallo-hydrolase [Clostridiales bacterium]|nr:MBL fold metallo-hydrolase [Clostridiales bacterium]
MATKRNKRKKNPQIKLSLKALIIVLVLCVALVACYLFVPPVKTFVDGVLNPSVFPSIEQRGEEDLRVHFIDVGQGDSIYIEFPDGTNMLIDGGDKEFDDEVQTYLTDLEVTTLNYLLVTHYDADHIGGLDEVFGYTAVLKVYLPTIGEGEITTNAYEDLLTAIENENCEVLESKMGTQILSTDTDNQFRLLWLSPDDDDLAEVDNEGPDPDSLDKNNISPIMLLEYQDKQIVFTGDANVTVERDVIQRYLDDYYGDITLTDVEVLKAGHHGSNGTGNTTQIKSGSSCQEFLELLNPEYFIISVGEGNNHGHPHQPVLDRAEGVGATIYRTDHHGNIIVTVRADATLPVEIYTSVQAG